MGPVGLPLAAVGRVVVVAGAPGSTRDSESRGEGTLPVTVRGTAGTEEHSQ